MARNFFTSFGRSSIRAARDGLGALLILGVLLAGQSASPVAALGTIRYVSPTGLTSGTCNSWVNACELQRALATVAVSGDELWVKQGTYKPTAGSDHTISFVLRNGIALYGGFAGTETLRTQRNWTTNVTTLSGEIGDPGLTLDNTWHVVVGSGTDSTAVLDGFFITAGNANSTAINDWNNVVGGGMLNYGLSSPTVSNDTFYANTASYGGGGMHNSVHAGPILTNVVFDNNTAPDGGAMYNTGYDPVDTQPRLTDVTFVNNTSTGSYGGGALFNDGGAAPVLTNVTFDSNSASGFRGGAMVNQDGGSAVLKNVTFYNNSGGDGGAVYNTDSLASFTNVTFSGNTASGSGGAMYNDQYATITIDNSIMWGDGSSEVVNNGGGVVTIRDSVHQGACASGSSCSNVFNADPFLGPLQSNGGPTKTMALGAGGSALDAGNDATCATTDQRHVSRVSPPQGAHCDIGAYEHVYASVLYASPTGLTSGFCESWAQACQLYYALPLSVSGEQIWAKAGSHMPTPGSDRNTSFVLKNGVALYGGFAGTETALNQRDPSINESILDGNIGSALDASDNSCHVVDGVRTESTALLDGFTISNGNATSGCNDTNGGGMINAGGPTLKNLTFAANHADSFGGGLSSSVGQPHLSDSTFVANTASMGGGGMYNNTSDAHLTNVTFVLNGATQHGGAMENDYSNPTLTNVTMSGNNAASGGGALDNFNSDPVIANSILWGNLAPSGHEILNASSTPGISFSVVEDSGGSTSWDSGLGTDGGGNLDSDPMLSSLADNGGFTETMAFLAGSPAIDAGDTGTCAANDQRGVIRPQGPACDMGAFEVSQTSVLFRSLGSQDGWVLESSENSGTGGTLNAVDTQFNLGDDAANRQYRAILSFNTGPTLPDTAVITSATLKIKKTALVGANPFLSLGDIAIDVRQGGFGGNAALQLTDFAAAGTKNFVGRFTNTPVGMWYSGAVKPGYLHYLSLTSGNQFRLRFYTDDNNNLAADYLRFASGNAITSSRPVLTITYYMP